MTDFRWHPGRWGKPCPRCAAALKRAEDAESALQALKGEIRLTLRMPEPDPDYEDPGIPERRPRWSAGSAAPATRRLCGN